MSEARKKVSETRSKVNEAKEEWRDASYVRAEEEIAGAVKQATGFYNDFKKCQANLDKEDWDEERMLQFVMEKVVSKAVDMGKELGQVEIETGKRMAVAKLTDVVRDTVSEEYKEV